MNTISFLYRVLFLGVFLLSCNSKEKYDKTVLDSLNHDLSVITEPETSIIHRIDGTSIEVSELDNKIKSLMDVAKVTGLAISIINNNEIVYKKAFGYSNYKRKNILQINHSFYGASLSKSVFGYLTSILANEGIIDLDKPLQQYLNFPLYEIKTNKK